MRRPTTRQRKLPEAPSPPAGAAKRSYQQTRRPPIKTRSFGDEGPGFDRETRLGRRLMLLELPLAPVPHHLRQGNAHRANRLTAPAEGGGVREVNCLLDTDQRRSQYRTHAPWMDSAVGLA